ncbi:peptidoglycan-binding domain-containing protein [Streptomyces sp. NPDC002838]|uniref:peptidoglycan-binding domain-containing protein n=1 Tax=Streptomyces sp. NPDC002838 TaxID=3154436 RepID=UPI0033329472
MRIRAAARTKAAFTVGAVVAGLLGGAVAVAPSASAASYPVCNTTTIGYFTNGTYWVLPYYSSPNTVSCILKQGNTGKAVRALQKNLNVCYGKALVLDGVFGAATAAALRDVQSRIGVAVDGVYGPLTRNKMKWARYSPETGAKYDCHAFA